MLENEVHVWYAELDRDASQQALLWVLGHYLDADPETIELRRGEHGKPALADPAIPLHFNLSHSGGAALIALSGEYEIGVDIERIVPRSDLVRLAARTLGPAMAAEIDATPQVGRLRTFYEAWARHEAAVKCFGSGLHRPPPPGPVAVRDVDAGPGFAAAVAVAVESVPRLRHFDFTEERRASAER